MPASKPRRLRSSKAHIWVRPELLKQVNQLAEERGLSRDGAFEEGLNMWVSAKMKETNDRRKH